MTRYQQLRQRREKLIELNKKNHYTVSGHPKMDKYLKCLLEINRECVKLQLEYDKKFDKSKYKFNAYINYNNY